MTSWDEDTDSWHGDLVSWQGRLFSWRSNLNSRQVSIKKPERVKEFPRKIFPISVEHTLKAVCPLGTTLLVDVVGLAPEGYKTFEASSSDGILFNVEGTKFNFSFPEHPCRWYLQPSCKILLTALAPSSMMFSDWIRVTYFKSGEEHSNCVAMMNITCISFSLTVEMYGDKENQKRRKMNNEVQGPFRVEEKAQFSWKGPIMLVNCKSKNTYPPETDNYTEEILDKDKVIHRMSKMILKIHSPIGFFNIHQLIINCSHPDRVRLFGIERPTIKTSYKMILGPNKPCHTVTYLRNSEKREFYVEALSFPDADFSGMVSFTFSLLDHSNEDVLEPLIQNSRVDFRVAPWIMTPSTQPAKAIYMTSKLRNQPLRPWRFWRNTKGMLPIKWLTGSLESEPESELEPEPESRTKSNKSIPWSRYLNTILDYIYKTRIELIFCPKDEVRLDTWIGNEVAIGYTQSPQQCFPVFLDLPWSKKIKDFVFKNTLPSSLGYVIREREDDDNLDASGFLEVSPPVTVHGIFYPLGRILIGDGSLPRENITEVNQNLRKFIYAQNLQEPLELFSEWLLEGNVKGFLAFVPANDRKGFRLLLASPSACYQLFRMEQKFGHGNACVLDTVDESILHYAERVKMSIDEILADKSLQRQNDYVETCIAWNRRVLKKELGLSERDIIDIPQLFRLGWVKDPSTEKEVLRAAHFFPNMLNMIVLESFLGIPKPYGPLIQGVCCVEKKVRSLLEPLGLNCFFTDEFFGHQEDLGDAYYWINIHRKPLPFQWWTWII
ncbi:protein-arginine deiminase type-4-like [Macrotis lagotis]|uniref:protein-arginine deiminase type-4-like n=1 Tax=Macrotis lagotis TaxID=92651 RepID=UPI003D6976FF